MEVSEEQKEKELRDIDRVVTLVQNRANKLKVQVENNSENIVQYSRAFHKFWDMFDFRKIGKKER